MVQLQILEGVKVEICVDDQPLPEYLDPDTQDAYSAVTRFIEAKSDQVFCIKLTIKRRANLDCDVLHLRMFIDGKESPGVAIDRRSLADSRGHRVIHRVKGIESSNGELLHFAFSELETASDGYLLTSENLTLRDLGSIRIKIHQRVLVSSLDRDALRSLSTLRTTRAANMSKITPPEQTNHVLEDGVGTVSEKAIKGRALSHSVSFIKETVDPTFMCRNIGRASVARCSRHCAQQERARSEVTVDHSGPCSTLSADPGRYAFQKPLGTIVFKYRSYAALKALLVIPRTPTPEPLESRDPASLNHQEIAELQRRIMAQTAIKREKKSDGDARTRKKARLTVQSARFYVTEDGVIHQSDDCGHETDGLNDPERE